MNSPRPSALSGRAQPVAIVGISYRLPRGSSLAAFAGVSRAPADRQPSRDGGFLAHVAVGPYAESLGISPREAEGLNGPPRLAWELGRESLDDAGILPGTLGEEKAGVFLGPAGSGPSSVHRAAESLGRGDLTVALAGALGRDTFATDATDGGGEFAGLIVLKPLSRALSDGDRVYGVIRQSAGDAGGADAPEGAPGTAALRIEPHGTGARATAAADLVALLRALLGTDAVHPIAPSAPAVPTDGSLPWPLTGATDAALAAQARHLADHLAGRPDLTAAQVGHALAAQRPLRHRAVVIGNDLADFRAGLRDLAAGEPSPHVAARGPSAAAPGTTVFVFPGQGSQWAGMGLELLDHSPVFAEHLHACARALAPHWDRDLLDVLARVDGAPGLERAEVVQPALFAVTVALARLWQSLGVEPDAVIGHSNGDIAASHVAGALTLEDAALVVARWSRVQSTLPGGGRMLYVSAPAAEVSARLERWRGRLVLAAVNGPAAVVVSGDADAADEFVAESAADGVYARPIAVDLAAHSPHFDPILDLVHAELAPIRPRRPTIPLHSTVSGRTSEVRDAAYWCRNMRHPVEFESVTRSLLDEGHTLFIEVSAHPLLTHDLQQTIEAHAPGRDIRVTGTLRRNDGGWRRMLTALAAVHGHHPVAWGAFHPHDAPRADLPTPTPEAASAGLPLITRLTGLPAARQERLLLDRVRAEVNAVSGGAAASLHAERSFRDIGFDSAAVVEVRDRLARATGLTLPATLLFSHPTPLAVARFLHAELFGAPRGPAAGPGPGPGGARDADEPIAIVGMGCRYPGADSPEALWRLVAEGADATSGFPTDRGWDIEGLFDPDPERPGRSHVARGGFVPGVPEFDAGFFGISPREATAMDPQQRLMLETAWEALERAGIDPGTLRGSPTGVFVGMTTQDYAPPLHQGTEESEGFLLTGNTLSVASGRIAYTLGLEGPALTVDSACSASLVSLHLAARALRDGECTLALAGGVCVMSGPGLFVEFSRQRGLSADGRCKAFAQAADGTAWGEGAGALVLERLSDAERNGHRVLAVIRGSAVNQDGASNGLAAPSGPAQERVIRGALAHARLEPSEVDAVEAHGTGTTLGDPIEAQAIIATYGQDRPAERPLWLGSLKSNIGHTQTAAGVAGVIKMVMALRHGTLPRTLHVDEPTRHVDWSAGRVSLLTEPVPWPETGRPRRAGVSSFGISGTNAHLILEQAPADRPAEDVPESLTGGWVPWRLSARTEDALRLQAARLRDHLDLHPELTPARVGHALATARGTFEHRAVLVGEDAGELRTALDVLAGDAPLPVSRPDGGTVFVFPGQGAQWAGMGAELLRTSPEFAEHLERCAAALRPFTGWDLLEVLTGAEGAPGLDRVEVVQPALFAVMVSLARLWQGFGVSPDAVVGHSQGEIAAAHVAGALSLDDAARVVALRARALAGIAGHGGMVSLPLPRAAVSDLIGPWGERIAVAAVNGPAATVVSGSAEVLDELLAHCGREGVQARRVPVDYASHSAHVEALRGPLLEALAPIRPTEPAIPFVSAVAGHAEGPLDADYWYRNLRHTVEFEDAVRALADDGHTLFIEVSPHPVLAPGIEDIAEATATGTLRRDDGGWRRVLTSLAAVDGHTPVDWTRFFTRGTPADLPTYPFQRRRFWLAPTPAADPGGLGLSDARHPLLGAVVPLADGDEHLFTGRLSPRTHPWLLDHAVDGAVLLPGTAFLELALGAGAHAGAPEVEELAIEAPLVMAEEGAVQLQVRVGTADAQGRRSIAVHSRSDDGPWARHATGALRGAGTAASGAPEPAMPAEWPPPGAVALSLHDFYERLAASGFAYGPAFRGLRAAWRRGDEVFAEVALPGEAGEFGLHPALADAALHALFLTQDAEGDGARWLPFSWRGVALHAVGATALRVRVSPVGEGAFALLCADDAGEPVVSADGLVMRPLARGELPSAGGSAEGAVYRVDWAEAAPPGPEAGTAVGWAVWGGGALPGALARSFGNVEHAENEEYEEHAENAGVPWVAEGAAPGVVVIPFTTGGAATGQEVPAEMREVAVRALAAVREWLADERSAGARLVVATANAVAVRDGESVADLVSAPVWGLVRSAQAEYPGRVVLLDVDGGPVPASAVRLVATGGEDQVAVRDGVAYVPRVVRAGGEDELAVPPGGAGWRLDLAGRGSLDHVHLAEFPGARAPLGPGQVRVSVRASGVNFRDVLLALDMVPGDSRPPGGEVAGVVLEVGPGVDDLVPGERVMGLVWTGTGPVAVLERSLLTRMPRGWSFTDAAAVPIVFLTAWYALRDLADVRPGERLLVHAAAGGVGMAALQLARHWGVEVYGTASPGKWPALRERGLDSGHLASSRSLDFEDEFRAATGGRGFDVVLNSLAGAFTDASLRLTAEGGRFLEMGKTDIRTPGDGIDYRAFDLMDAGPRRIGEMLDELRGLFDSGALAPVPTAAWDVRHARRALRHLSQARHTGKVVLTYPTTPHPRGTVLITGGTGTLGALLARHFAARGEAGHLLLTSRRGPDAPGATALAEELRALGAKVTIAACDAADRGALAAQLASIPPAHPLTTVVHAAGVLDDGPLHTQTPERFTTVLGPKADAAWNLHRLTEDTDLAEFVLFSSVAATLP
nr:type I polyketide synthase [Streptomyces sp. SBT349]